MLKVKPCKGCLSIAWKDNTNDQIREFGISLTDRADPYHKHVMFGKVIDTLPLRELEKYGGYSGEVVGNVRIEDCKEEEPNILIQNEL